MAPLQVLEEENEGLSYFRQSGIRKRQKKKVTPLQALEEEGSTFASAWEEGPQESPTTLVILLESTRQPVMAT